MVLGIEGYFLQRQMGGETASLEPTTAPAIHDINEAESKLEDFAPARKTRLPRQRRIQVCQGSFGNRLLSTHGRRKGKNFPNHQPIPILLGNPPLSPMNSDRLPSGILPIHLLPMKPNKPRCAKLRNWKPPKPTEDFLICMNSGRRLSLSAPEDAFKVNAIIHCSRTVDGLHCQSPRISKNPKRRRRNPVLAAPQGKQGKLTASLACHAAAAKTA